MLLDSLSSPSSPRPKVQRTYGRPRLIPSSPPHHASSSTSTSWSSNTLSSSPMPSSLLVTPPSSPPAKRARLDIQVKGSSPARFGEDEKENVFPSNEPASSKAAKRDTKQGSIKGFFTALPRQKVAPLQPVSLIPPTISHDSSSHLLTNHAKTSSSQTIFYIRPISARPASTSTLQQSYLTHLPLLESCKACCMTYVRGGEDPGVHARHHGRVMRGIPWEGLGKGKGKAKGETGWKEIKEVTFGKKGDGKGRVVVCEGSWGGSKLDDILQTVDLSLSSPPLPPAILDRCKIFLLLTSSSPPISITGKRKPSLPTSGQNGRSAKGERIVSIVVAQGIKWAMRVLGTDETVYSGGVKMVDSGGGVMCDPTPLDTPLGIHRLYTIPSYRSLGLAQILLDATLGHTVYGCLFDPRKGQVAFSQPTESGRKAMLRWGGGEVRVFVDDESQT